MLSENEDNIRKELLKLMKHFECPICLNLMSDLMITRCVHRFCGQCINKAIESSVNDFCRCPLCNEKITKRALRRQSELSDLIKAFKEAVDSFEKDNNSPLITNTEDVVVFDVSTSLAKINDTIEDKMDESVNKTIDSLNVTTDVETSRRTTISTASGDWPTAVSTDVDITEDMNETDVYFDSAKKSMNGKTNDNSMESIDKSICETNGDKCETKATQSQNLTVNKSKITYSSSRNTSNDKFDEIIGLSNIQIKQKEELNRKLNQELKPKSVVAKEYVSSESEPEVDCNGETLKPKERKQLIPKFVNKNLDQKKKLKRIEKFDSSDDFSSPLVVNNKQKVRQKSNNLDTDWSDEDLFSPPNPNKTNSCELNRTNDSVRDENTNGYNSDTQLITSSPFSSDF